MDHPSYPVATATRVLYFATAALLLTVLPYEVKAGPGTLDKSFGAGHVITKLDNFDDSGHGVVIQSDGRIIVAGTVGRSTGGSDFGVARYHDNGLLDKSFGGTGKVTTSFALDKKNAYRAQANAAVIQANGKCVVGGESPSGDIALVRYNGTGNLDHSFSGGKVTTDYGAEEACTALAIQSDGKILAAGVRTSLNNASYLLARYNTDGTLDTTLNGTGIVLTDFGAGIDSASGVIVQTDGKIVVTGSVQISSGQSAFGTVRYNTDGSLDPTFGGTGKVMTVFNPGLNQAHGVQVQADGKIVVVGQVPNPANNSLDIGVARYTAAGAPDPAFNGTGTVSIDFGGASAGSLDNGTGLVVQPDGSIVVVGTQADSGNNAFEVARLTTGGVLDTTFHSTGKLTTAIASADNSASAVVLAGTKIVVAGTASTGNHDAFAVLRYNADGTPDTTFYPIGKVTTAISTHNDGAYSVAIAPSGKIILAGAEDLTPMKRVFAVVSLNPDGTRDTSFNHTGKATLDLGGEASRANDIANAVAVQADGKVVLAGGAGNISEGVAPVDFAIARYGVDGQLDTTFNGNGLAITDFGGDEQANAMALTPEGKIVAVGTTYKQGHGDIFDVLRLNPDGTLDGTFNDSGKASLDFSYKAPSGQTLAIYGLPSAVAVQGDSKILVGGVMQGDGLHYQLVVLRLTADGFLDTTFNGTGRVFIDLGPNANPVLTGLALQADGKIVVGGTDRNFQGPPPSVLARLNPDGSSDSTFGDAGRIMFNVPDDYILTLGNVVVQMDQKILVMGAISYSGTSSGIGALRFLPDGSPDTSFNYTGQEFTKFSRYSFNSVGALQPDGKIVVGGVTYNGVNNDFAVLRYQGGD